MRIPYRATLPICAGAVLATACGGPTRDEEPEIVPVAVSTLAPERVRAGDSIDVTCVLLDRDGGELAPEDPPVFALRFAPADAVEPTGDGGFMAVVAGELEVSCSVPSLLLIDDTPALTRVEPGEVARLGTRLDTDLVVAGGEVAATCDAFDAWGNPVDDAEPGLRLVPALAENSIDGLSATLIRTGVYEAVCDLPGTESTGALVEVLPGPPSSLVISRVPDLPVYAQGQIVSIHHIVSDAYGNQVPEAQVAVSSSPAASVESGSHFRYFADGVYQLTATVIAPAGGSPLTAETEVFVDGRGPSVSCDSPADGAIIHHEPGAPLTFSGTASDVSGVQEVRVNGNVVSVAGDGTFSTTVGTRFGINFVHLAVVDENGIESTRTCSYLAADRWRKHGAKFDNSVSLKLRPPAVDDTGRSGGISSLGDILHAVLNSSGLAQAVHDLLLDANPLKPMSCDYSQWPVGCVFKSQIEYLASELNGPNDISLEPIGGGLAASLTMNNVRMRLRVTGTCSSTGWVTVSSVTAGMDFDAFLQGGRPHIAVVPSSVKATVGSLNTDFSGACGWVFDNIVLPFAKNAVRDLISKKVTNLIRNRFNDVLDGVMGGLDISALGTSFSVPRLDGGPPIELAFSPGFSHLSATTGRLLFGLSSRFGVAPAHARPTMGAPIPQPNGPFNPSISTPAAVSIHSGLLAQALHALWRGGFFDATISGDSLGGSFPDGASATLTTRLPPAIELGKPGRVRLSLGDVLVTLSYPSLFAEPVHLVLGVRASMHYELDGDDLVFSDFKIGNLLLTSQQLDLDQDTKDILETFLSEVLGEVIGKALDDALPALPVPSFELPASVSTYGLPAGAELGLTSPQLGPVNQRFVLRGSLGVQ